MGDRDASGEEKRKPAMMAMLMSEAMSKEEEAKGEAGKKVSTIPMENSAPGRLSVRRGDRMEVNKKRGEVTSETI